MNIIRWGIIGCGDVCEVKSGPAFQKADGSALVAVMRRDEAKAADYAKRHRVARWYCDADELINDAEVDAVYIATPPGRHEELSLRVAAAGKPCYVEKPMARSYGECCRMNQAFADAGKPLFVAYYRRRLPRFLRAKYLIDSGRLGKVTGCHYRLTRYFWPNPPQQWRLSAKDSGGGLFLDLGSHALDQMDFLLGPFTEFGGCAQSTGATAVEDRVAIHFQTERGIVGTANWNFAGSAFEDMLEIVGTEGRLSLSMFGAEPLRLQREEQGEVESITTETFAETTPPHVHQPLVQTMVDQLLGRGECPSTGESAARTARVMDAALEGYYGSRDDAFWERPQTWPGSPRAMNPHI
jgi:1,5-anhydro-D-fructose reductase (1,5-anhydro-D-mannitol-forming)